MWGEIEESQLLAFEAQVIPGEVKFAPFLLVVVVLLVMTIAQRPVGD